MLKGISKILSPDLLKILCEMGHGDEIVIADANFPSANYGKRVIRADGISGIDMLNAVLSVFPLDTYSEPNMILMQLMDCDVGKINPEIWAKYKEIAQKNDDNTKIGNIDRFEFYDRAKEAYAVIATGEEAVYANILLKKALSNKIFVF
jgi:L-fucose mutarotase